MPDIYERYFDWNDFLNYVDVPDEYPANSKRRSHDYDRDGWFGTPSFGRAMYLARYGWAEHLDKIKNTDIDCFDMLNQQQLWETKHSVVGSGVDIGRYVIGMPDCMLRADPYYVDTVCSSPKFVNIVVNTSYCSVRDFNYVLARGVQILGAINTLELNNVRTRIILLTNAAAEEDTATDLYRIYIKLKDYQDMFYLEKLMFPIAHPSFLRRLIFAAQEREPHQIRNLFGFYRDRGYGYPTNKFEYRDKNILYFGAEPLHNDRVKEWLAGVLRGDPKDYDGCSRLDIHLDELRYAMARDKMHDR